MVELWVKCEMLAGISGVLGRWSGVDPGFEIGGCPKCARKRANFFSVPHSLSSPQPCLGTLELSSQLASTSRRWLKIIILRLFVATAVNIKAFLMQEQGDCSPLTL